MGLVPLHIENPGRPSGREQVTVRIECPLPLALEPHKGGNRSAIVQRATGLPFCETDF